MKFVNNPDINLNQLLNALLQLLGTDPGSPAEGQIWYNTTTKQLKFRDNAGNRRTLTDLTTLDLVPAPAADVSLNNRKITNLLDPTSAQDAVTKAYVDALRQGLDLKDSVRAATTANISLTGTQTIDGVSLVATNRVLVKNQTTQSENGIYVVAAGAWARAADADANAEVTSGMYFFVEEGTTQGDTGWVLSTDGTIIVGTTSLTFVQFSSAGVILADEVTLTKSGSTLSIKSTYQGQTSIVTLGTITTGVWQGTAVAIAFGGTGATTAAVARDASHLNVPQRGVAVNIGDNSDLEIEVVHGLGTEDVVPILRLAAGTKEAVLPDWRVIDANTIRFDFSVAPTANQYRAIIVPIQ